MTVAEATTRTLAVPGATLTYDVRRGTGNDLPLITDPAERRRFLDETPAVVLGTLLHHPFAQLQASACNAFVQLARFNVASDVGEALYGLLHVKDDRRTRVAEIVPNIGPCLTEGGARTFEVRTPDGLLIKITQREPED